MSSIAQIVREAIARGYLTREAEGQLRNLLHGSSCDRTELRAFFQLQQGVMEGRVKQQSREELAVC
ncbi:MAG: hypothetical protein J7647_09445 [Cyanobacteria bacterium SBLK]|nr:hypothetical protein [Cyanobacteria bacterium SBLK]